jgi:sugar (pentulose or hexulose) kinase
MNCGRYRAACDYRRLEADVNSECAIMKITRGTKHPLWQQLRADVFGMQVRTTQTPEAAAFGAALIAGVGAGEEVESVLRADV